MAKVKMASKKKRREWLKVLNLKTWVDLVPESVYPYKCTYPMDWEYIVIHNAAWAGTGKEVHDYGKTCCIVPGNFINLKSWHLTADELGVWQMLPLNRNGWHAGDGGKGAGNRKSIGIEISRDTKNPDPKRLYYKSEDNGAKAAAVLLFSKKKSVKWLRMHMDFMPSKACPYRIIIEKRWDEFKAVVGKYIHKLEIYEKTLVEEPKKVIEVEPEIVPVKKCKKVYRLQAGAFLSRGLARSYADDLIRDGFTRAMPFYRDGRFIVQASSHSTYAEALHWKNELTVKGYPSIIRGGVVCR